MYGWFCLISRGYIWCAAIRHLDMCVAEPGDVNDNLSRIQTSNIFSFAISQFRGPSKNGPLVSADYIQTRPGSLTAYSCIYLHTFFLLLISLQRSSSRSWGLVNCNLASLDYGGINSKHADAFTVQNFRAKSLDQIALDEQLERISARRKITARHCLKHYKNFY